MTRWRTLSLLLRGFFWDWLEFLIFFLCWLLSLLFFFFFVDITASETKVAHNTCKPELTSSLFLRFFCFRWFCNFRFFSLRFLYILMILWFLLLLLCNNLFLNWLIFSCNVSHSFLQTFCVFFLSLLLCLLLLAFLSFSFQVFKIAFANFLFNSSSLS